MVVVVGGGDESPRACNMLHLTRGRRVDAFEEGQEEPDDYSGWWW